MTVAASEPEQLQLKQKCSVQHSISDISISELCDVEAIDEITAKARSHT